MESLQQIKSRRKAVGNVGQITKAMEVVATTKMRKSQEIALGSRPYAYRALALLGTLSRHAPMETPLTKKREVKNTLVLVLTSDRGLIGSFNTQVLRAFDEYMRENKDRTESHKFVTVGKKATNYLRKKGFEPGKSYEGFGDFVSHEEVAPLRKFLVDGFFKGDWDRVVTFSTYFKSTLKQEVYKHEILPVDISQIKETVKNIVPEEGRFAEIQGSKEEEGNEKGKEIEYIFEPSPKEVLETLIPHLFSMQLYHLVLEANASEHSARRVAMKTASDNASELSTDLEIAFNKARQASITREIIEITSTQSALQ